MGYFGNEHIQNFCVGKTIKCVETLFNVVEHVIIRFTDGTYLKLYPYNCGASRESVAIIVNPFKENNEVMQSTEIMRSQHA